VNNINNCGGCGRVCSAINAIPSCNAGTCGVATCLPGFGNCNNVPFGCMFNLNTDSANCGACGHSVSYFSFYFLSSLGIEANIIFFYSVVLMLFVMGECVHPMLVELGKGRYLSDI